MSRRVLRHELWKASVLGGLLLLSPFLTETTMAQTTTTPTTPTPTPTSPEIEELRRQVERAELEKKLTEFERAELVAKLPTSQTKGPDGSVTLKDGAGYYAELLAYGTLRTTAAAIAEEVKSKITGKTVVLSDQFDLATNDTLWQLIDSRLTDFDGRLQALIDRYQANDGSGGINVTEVEAVPAAALVALPAILGAASDIAAFFRVNREITGRAVKLSNRALLAEMAKALLAQGPVVVPSLRVGATGSLVTRLSALQEKRRKVNEIRTAVRKHIAPDPVRLEQLTTQLTAKRAELAELRKAGAPAATIQVVTQEAQRIETDRVREATRIDRWKRATDEIDPVLQEFTALETTLTSRPAGQAQSPLEAVAGVDVIRSLGGNGKTLLVSIESQGAEIEVTKTAWTSGRISYIGGSVVSFFLLDDKGTLQAAGTIPQHRAASFRGAKGATALEPVVSQ
jgi:hypothetical protein